jgi:DNA-binding FadR family transcriptional regulator
MSTAPLLADSRPNLASEIERSLAREILRGERVPGSHLPPVRDLARIWKVTPPTIQRVVDRLEASGLVSARRGSGVTVNDPLRSADLSLLPLWFEALADQPERAESILDNFLELRRVVAAHLARSAADRILAAAPRLLERLQAVEEAKTLTEVTEADLAFTRAVVEAANQFAVASIFHTAERLVREVPHLSEALYGDRAYHRRALRRAIGALAGAPAEAVSELEQALAVWDRRTVTRFRQLLEQARSKRSE